MIDFISQPWPWWVGGTMIAVIALLMRLVGRRFGVSSTLETLCTVGNAGRFAPYFAKDWKADTWKLVFVSGAVIGGAVSVFFFENPEPVAISDSTSTFLTQHGIAANSTTLVPTEIFNWANLISLQGLIFMVLGGFLIGFGTRYAGGCTSGHAISGISELQLPSIIATASFFVGGLISTWLILPFLLDL